MSIPGVNNQLIGNVKADLIVSDIEFRAISNSTLDTGEIRIPADTQPGDLLYLQTYRDDDGDIIGMLPPGWTEVVAREAGSAAGGAGACTFSIKKAEIGDANTLVQIPEASTSSDDYFSVMLVFSGSWKSPPMFDASTTATTSNPAARTLDPSLVTTPIFVIASFFGTDNGALNNRINPTASFTPDQTWHFDSSMPGFGTADLYVWYKIYNDSPEAISCDQDDGGFNILHLFYAVSGI